MKTAVVVRVSGAVAVFGVTSAVLGFIAEAKRITAAKIYVSGGKCVYPDNPAHTLGICAIFLLAVSQIIASAARGGCCCRRPPGGASSSISGGRRVVGVIASVLSWLAAVVAGVFYWAGVSLNAPRTRQAKFVGTNEECSVLKGGVFVRAAVIGLVATALGIISCVMLRLPPATDVPVEGQHVVGMPEWQAPDPKLAPPPPQGQAHAQVQV